MSNHRHSNLESVIKNQSASCNLLKDVTEVLFGLDDVNKDLVNQLDKEVSTLQSGIGGLRRVLSEMRNENEKLKCALENVASVDKFLDDLANQDDFRRLFRSPEKTNTIQPQAECRTESRTQSKKSIVSVPEISNEEYNTVPFYTRGRIKADEVNEFISSINATLSKKYQILRSTRLTKYEERQLQFQYKLQEQSCKGHIFFTEEDLLKFGFLRNTIAVPKLLNILRATRRIKEIRSQGSVKFAVKDSNEMV